MTLRLAQVTLASGVKQTVSVFPTGLKGLIIGNESGFTCDVLLENGDEKTLYPGTADYFNVPPSFSGTVFITPSIVLATAIVYPGSTLFIDGVSPLDNVDVSAYPMALSRPMQAGPSSPGAGFSTYTTFTVTASPTGRYILNLFNGSTLGVIYRLFSSQIKQNGVGTAVTNISVRTDGTDNNLGSGSSKVIQHSINNGQLSASLGAPPSQAHATFLNNGSIPAQNTFIYTFLVENTDPAYDFISPPDARLLYPGQNWTCDVQNPIGSSLISMVFKWGEA